MFKIMGWERGRLIEFFLDSVTLRNVSLLARSLALSSSGSQSEIKQFGPRLNVYIGMCYLENANLEGKGGGDLVLTLLGIIR